jgi:putative transposase
VRSISHAIYNLDTGFKNFFEGRANPPKFKSKRDHHYSYTTDFTNNNIEIQYPNRKFKNGKIKLPKLRWVEANIHRHPENDWIIKTATVSLTPSGKYFVSITFEYNVEDIAPIVPTIQKTLGLDYSSPLFYVDSNGEPANVPHWYREAEARLAREQRRLSKMVKGSNHYEKQRKLIAKLSEHIANQRKDFCHKLSREIANQYDVVCVEDLDLHNLAQTLTLGKSTNDNGFGMFRVFLKYKLERLGKYYVVIDKWYPSTKTCHACGHVNPDVELKDSTWVCPHCGRVVQRDPNAAFNIKHEGFSLLMESLSNKAA